ncbi:unnamed protein product [Parajaminaea phylloscopi]
MPSLSRVIGSIRRKAPTAPDGRYDEEAGTAKTRETSIIHDLFHLKGRDAVTLANALKDMSAGEPMDDRALLLERGVEMLQGLPSNSGLSHTISDGFIGMLWNEMPHPPLSSLEPKSRYRTADGSGNNPWNPDMGKAGSAYSRTVPPVQAKSPFQPDPSLVFDQLLQRTGFTEHKGGLNSLFTAFATFVIHNCFETEHARPWVNQTSSYVDLAPLYGNNQEQQDSVRTHIMGGLHPDVLASPRIFMMPPGVVAIALLFSRHHNYLAEALFKVNECGKYKPWDALDEQGRVWQDEDLFQLARNINIAFFAKAVLTDYVSAILATVRADSDWHLELGKEIKDMAGKRLERGTGNVVSADFATLYHWHSLLSQADEDWMTETLTKTNPGKKLEDIGASEFMAMAKKHKETLDSSPPSGWTFGGLERDESGYFRDDQLAKVIKDAIEQPAHAFGARSIPKSMKIVDIMSQLQARETFNLCTMNEFRSYFNLKPFASFLEWNSDPEIASAAERLYGHIDHLELYPGLMAEESKPNVPGSGVQPGHTIGRAILCDAVTLIRADRFLTVDLNSSTLTNWGMAQIEPVPGAYGGFFPHLLYRGLPRSWGRYSTYTLLPFYTPKAVGGILRKNRKQALYEFERPEDVSKLHGVHSYAACKQVFADRDLYRNIYHYNLDLLTDRAGFMIGFDDKSTHDRMSGFMHEAFFEPNFESNVREWYAKATKAHIAKAVLSFSNSKRRQLNVTRDVFNTVPVIWLADRYAIPLKTEATPHGLFTVFQLQAMLTGLFIYSSFDVIPHASWVLRQAAVDLGPAMRNVLKLRLENNHGAREKIHDRFAKGTAYEVSEAADHLYHTIQKKKVPVDEAVGNLLGTAIPIAGNITQQSTLILDLFLTPGYEYAKDRFTELAHQTDEASEKELEMWVWEAMRISGVVPGLPRVAARDVVIDDGPRQVHVKAGERLIIATSRAHLDPTVFPNPERLDPTRDPKLYILLGHGLHFCFGARLVAPSIVAMLREVFKLKGLRRAPGRRGELIRIPEQLGHNRDACTIQTYLDQNCKQSPVPSTFVIEYDEE